MMMGSGLSSLYDPIPFPLYFLGTASNNSSKPLSAYYILLG
jgi:hypothetical protein